MTDAGDPMRRQGCRIVDVSPRVCQGDACPDCTSDNPRAMSIEMSRSVGWFGFGGNGNRFVACNPGRLGGISKRNFQVDVRPQRSDNLIEGGMTALPNAMATRNWFLTTVKALERALRQAEFDRPATDSAPFFSRAQ
jgi:hypothetical protein